MEGGEKVEIFDWKNKNIKKEKMWPSNFEIIPINTPDIYSFEQYILKESIIVYQQNKIPNTFVILTYEIKVSWRFFSNVKLSNKNIIRLMIDL